MCVCVHVHVLLAFYHVASDTSKELGRYHHCPGMEEIVRPSCGAFLWAAREDEADVHRRTNTACITEGSLMARVGLPEQIACWREG